MNSTKATLFYVIILIPLIYFAIFLHIDSLPFRVWDEAYLATHTYEMMHDHNYLVTHSFSEPEMSNTKPPLVIWCMVLSCKLLGFNELSVRLPNALAGVFICIIIFSFCRYWLKSSFIGFLSVAILVSSKGFIRLHVTRSGEYDALLVLFITIFSLSYFLILEDTTKKNWKKLWLTFCVSLVLAILTKGIAACLILPGLLIYTLFQKKLVWLFKSKEFYACVLITLSVGVGYYFLREHYNPGYIKAVFENELGGRYNKPMIESTPLLYINEIIFKQYTGWFVFFFIGLFCANSFSDNINRKLVHYSASISIILLIVITIGSTRLDWYDAPMFPFLSLVSAYGFYFVINKIFEIGHDRMKLKKYVLMSFFIMLLVLPNYYKVIASNLSIEEDLWDADSYNLTHYIELKEKRHVNLNGYKIMVDWYMWRALNCQVRKWNDKDQKIIILTNINQVKTGDFLITNKIEDRKNIDVIYNHKLIDSYKNIETWQVLTKKP